MDIRIHLPCLTQVLITMEFLHSETGLNYENLNRLQVVNQLDLNDEDFPDDVPLLYGLVKLV